MISFGKEKLVKVYNEVKTVYNDKAMNCTSVHDALWCGRPSIMTDKIVEIIKKCSVMITICDESTNLQISATQNHLKNPQISETVHEMGPKTTSRPTQVELCRGREVLRCYNTS
jgi:hypothetical protein